MTELAGQYDAWVFDWDDTVVQTYPNKLRQHMFVAREWYGLDLTPEAVRAHWGKPMHVMLRHLYQTEDVETVKSILTMVRTDYPKIAFGSSITVLKVLKSWQKKNGLVTANSRHGTNVDFADLQIADDLFDYVQVAEDTEEHKPDGHVFDPLKSWLAEQAIPLERSVYIGDGLLDMQAAVEAGLPFIGVANGHVSAEEFRDLGVTAINDLAELIV